MNPINPCVYCGAEHVPGVGRTHTATCYWSLAAPERVARPAQGTEAYARAMADAFKAGAEAMRVACQSSIRIRQDIAETYGDPDVAKALARADSSLNDITVTPAEDGGEEAI